MTERLVETVLKETQAALMGHRDMAIEIAFSHARDGMGHLVERTFEQRVDPVQAFDRMAERQRLPLRRQTTGKVAGLGSLDQRHDFGGELEVTGHLAPFHGRAETAAVGTHHRGQGQTDRATAERQAHRLAAERLVLALHALHDAAQHVLGGTARKGGTEILLCLAEKAQQRLADINDAAVGVAEHDAGPAMVECGAQPLCFLALLVDGRQRTRKLRAFTGAGWIGKRDLPAFGEAGSSRGAARERAGRAPGREAAEQRDHRHRGNSQGGSPSDGGIGCQASGERGRTGGEQRLADRET